MSRDNVLDLNEKLEAKKPVIELGNSGKTLTLDQIKLAVTGSILSIVVLVCLANNVLLQPLSGRLQLASESASIDGPSRGIASVATGTSEREDELVRMVASHELSERAIIGRRPSGIESLTFGLLEGKYAVRLESGKIREIQISPSDEGAEYSVLPKHIDLVSLLQKNKGLFVVDFSRAEVASASDETSRVLNLIGANGGRVGRVVATLDGEGGLLSLRVQALSLAAR